MKPFSNFQNMPPSFWANVKFVSERLGYSDRKTKSLRKFTEKEIIDLFKKEKIDITALKESGKSTQLLKDLTVYLNQRATILETTVKNNLMNREEAEVEFNKIRSSYNPKCSLPMNKQKKKHHSYLTCIVNMLTELTLGKTNFDDNPRGLTVITKKNRIVKTLSRWMDGAFPSKINPIAVWEIKEYYGTTTFGSRVADGVYETMLDGEEINEVKQRENVKLLHYMIVDDKFTWWDCGRSYLCRIIDIMHMGLVDEVIFGREILQRWPKIVQSWIK